MTAAGDVRSAAAPKSLAIYRSLSPAPTAEAGASLSGPPSFSPHYPHINEAFIRQSSGL